MTAVAHADSTVTAMAATVVYCDANEQRCNNSDNDNAVTLLQTSMVVAGESAVTAVILTAL